MKGNRRRQWSFGKRWISLLVIAAMLISMFSGLALAEEPEQTEYESQEPAGEIQDDAVDVEQSEASSDEDDASGQDDIHDQDDDSDQDDFSDQNYDSAQDDTSGEGSDDAADQDDDAPTDSETDDTPPQQPDQENEAEPPLDETPSDIVENEAPEEEWHEVTGQVALQIVDVGWPDQLTYEMDEKPAYDDFAYSLPGTLTATLSDGSDYEVEAEWYCEDYSADYGRFIFSSDLVGSVPYEIARNVRLPKVALYIRYVSAVKLSGEKEYVVAEKPAQWSDEVAEAMKWPDTIKVTIEGESESRENLPIVWTCDDYDRADAGEFTFTAGFAPEVNYIIGRKVKMPAITLRVIDDEKFTLALTRDNTLAITGLKDTRSDVVEIPAKIAGIKVTEIADKAFEDCSNVMMVRVADGIEKIGNRAFHGCDSLLVVELPDSLEDVASNAFDDENLETLAIVLNVSGETKLTRDDTFKHDGETVRLPEPIDSIVVENDGELTIDTDFTVEPESFTGITVEHGGRLKLNKGNSLINHGTINVLGTFTNKGKVYGCDPMSTLTGDIDNYITAHTGKASAKSAGRLFPRSNSTLRLRQAK